jgi:hypothetical protein
LTPLVLPHPGGPPENDVPPRSVGQRVGYVAAAFQKGLTASGGKFAAATSLIGGSALAYGVFVAHLNAPWALLICVAVGALIYGLGAYELWSEAYAAAFRFMPTWEQLQTRADTLQGLIYGSTPDRFKNQYMGGHMNALRQDYDRADAAGHRPDFDRELIRTVELEEMAAVISSLEAAALAWKEAEENGEVS